MDDRYFDDCSWMSSMTYEELKTFSESLSEAYSEYEKEKRGSEGDDSNGK